MDVIGFPIAASERVASENPCKKIKASRKSVSLPREIIKVGPASFHSKSVGLIQAFPSQLMDPGQCQKLICLTNYCGT